MKVHGDNKPEKISAGSMPNKPGGMGAADTECQAGNGQGRSYSLGVR